MNRPCFHAQSFAIMVRELLDRARYRPLRRIAGAERKIHESSRPQRLDPQETSAWVFEGDSLRLHKKRTALRGRKQAVRP